MADTAYLRVAFRFKMYDQRWWEVYSTNVVDFPTVIARATAIVPLSIAFRHPACYISSIRVTNPFAQRQSQIVHVPNPARTIGTTVPETTSNAAVYEMATALAGVTRRVWFRGLRASDVGRYPNTGEDYAKNDLPGQTQSFYDALVTGGFGIASVLPVDTGDNKRHPIPSITVLPLKKVRLNVAEAFNLGARKRVILYRIPQKMFPGLRGRFTVTADGLGIYPIGYLAEMPEGNYPVNNSAFRNEEWRFSTFSATGLTFLAFNRRDTAGGPLGSRGHSRPLIRRSV